MREPYKIISRGKTRAVHLYGHRRLASILSDEEYQDVREGRVAAVLLDGGILDLSSPLEQGETIELKSLGT